MRSLHTAYAEESNVPTSPGPRDPGPLEIAVRADPSCSYWLRDRLRECQERDPLDALRDAETLVAILEERWQELVADRPAASPAVER